MTSLSSLSESPEEPEKWFCIIFITHGNLDLDDVVLTFPTKIHLLVNTLYSSHSPWIATSSWYIRNDNLFVSRPCSFPLFYSDDLYSSRSRSPDLDQLPPVFFSLSVGSLFLLSHFVADPDVASCHYFYALSTPSLSSCDMSFLGFYFWRF